MEKQEGKFTFWAIVIGLAFAVTSCVINSENTEQKAAEATASDLQDAQAAARRAVAEARIDGARPPLPVIHIYDADEGDECEGEKCSP